LRFLYYPAIYTVELAGYIGVLFISIKYIVLITELHQLSGSKLTLRLHHRTPEYLKGMHLSPQFLERELKPDFRVLHEKAGYAPLIAGVPLAVEH
jgi:hypothetical protein